MVPPAASLSVAGGSVVHCGDDDNNIESRIFDLAFRPLALDLLDEDTLPCGLPSFVPMEACPPMLRLYAVRLYEPAPLPAPAQPLAPGAMLTSLHASTVASQASHLFPGMGVKQVLGRGGYGTAYYGTWHDTDVVLKVQDHELKNLSALREAQLEVALGQMLRHPNLVRTLAHSAVEVNKQGWPHGGGTGVSSAISGGCPMASCSPLPSVWPMWGGGNNNSNNDGDPMADWDSCGADKWFEHSDAVMKRPPDWVNNISGLPPAHFLLDATSLAPDAPVPFAAAMLDATQQAKQAAAAAATNATAAGAAQASSLQGAAAAAAVVPTTSLDATTTIVPWANNNHNADGRATSAAQSDTVMSTFASDLVYLPAAGLQDLSSSAAPKTTTTTATSRRPPLAGGVPMSVPEESAVGANDSPPFGNVQPQQQGKPAAASHKQQQHTSVASSTGFGACGPLLSEEVAHLLASAEEHAARVSAAPLGFPLNLRTFVVLEFCDAGSLLDAIDRGWLRRGQCVASAPPNMTKVITLALHIASACAHLHSRGVVHADLSASNVLLCTARPSATVANLPGNSSSSTNVSAVVSPATSAAINAAPAPATAAQLVPDHNSIVRSTEVEDLDSSPAGGGGGGGGGGRNVSAPLGSRDAHSSVPAEDAAAAAAAASGYALPVKRFTLAPDKPRAADDMEFVAKVADFGKAVLLGPEGIVRAGGYATITHQAPEVLVEQLLSPAADVYALGVLVWQMFTGSRPWAGMSHQQIFGAIASGCMQLEWPNPAALLGVGGGVAAAVGGDALCSAGELAAAEGLVVLGRQCLSADREQRPTMAEAEARLKQLLRMLATRAAA